MSDYDEYDESPGYLLPNDELDQAIEQNRVGLVLKALEDGASNVEDGLYRASQLGLVGITEVLIDHGATNLNPSLQAASKEGHVNVVEVLLHHGATEFNPSFIMSVAHNHLPVAQLLLGAGADDVNIGLFIACGNVDMAQLMLDHGATDVTRGLINACKHNQVQTGKLMIQHGANIDTCKLALSDLDILELYLHDVDLGSYRGFIEAKVYDEIIQTELLLNDLAAIVAIF